MGVLSGFSVLMGFFLLLYSIMLFSFFLLFGEGASLFVFVVLIRSVLFLTGLKPKVCERGRTQSCAYAVKFRVSVYETNNAEGGGWVGGGWRGRVVNRWVVLVGEGFV